jgi:anthranilate/para-aminobenzoate synthase component I
LGKLTQEAFGVVSQVILCRQFFRKFRRNEFTVYRAFRKFAGSTPSEYLRDLK